MKYRTMTGALAGLVLLLAACQTSASPTGGGESAAPSEAAASVAASEAASTPPAASGVTLTIAETSAGSALAGEGGPDAVHPDR